MLRIVPDTNIIIASQKSASQSSPNKELFTRWENNEFDLLYSSDTLHEYIEKMEALDIDQHIIGKFIRALILLGQHIDIDFFHVYVYPPDPDDIAFLLCAVNGKASHIITYDSHLQRIDPYYAFKICPPLEFLLELRD